MKHAYEPRDSPRNEHIDFLISICLVRNGQLRLSESQKQYVRFYLKRARQIRNETGLGNLPA